ncbi:MAG: hypothetical protein ACRDIB_13540, partial [Ardenticatenaceae bacterium]
GHRCGLLQSKSSTCVRRQGPESSPSVPKEAPAGRGSAGLRQRAPQDAKAMAAVLEVEAPDDRAASPEGRADLRPTYQGMGAILQRVRAASSAIG